MLISYCWLISIITKFNKFLALMDLYNPAKFQNAEATWSWDILFPTTVTQEKKLKRI